jgi:predicted transport protein
VRERLGSEAVEEIDWRNARAVCIAGDFSRHDRVAVYENRRRIDLVRYRVFDGGLLSLLLIESSRASASPGPARQRGREQQAAAGAGDRLRPVSDGVPEGLRDLYGELDEALTAWGEVEVARLHHYIAHRRMVNRASVLFRPSHRVILVYLTLDPDTVELEEGFTRDMRGIGHLGTRDLEVRIASTADLDKAGPLIQRAFEAG